MASSVRRRVPSSTEGQLFPHGRTNQSLCPAQRSAVLEGRGCAPPSAGPADSVPEVAVVEVGDLTIDLARKRVARAGNDVPLTPTDWAFLELLTRKLGRLVTRERTLREVWGPAYQKEPHYLRIYAAQLRRKLEDDPAHPRQPDHQPRPRLYSPNGSARPATPSTRPCTTPADACASLWRPRATSTLPTAKGPSSHDHHHAPLDRRDRDPATPRHDPCLSCDDCFALLDQYVERRILDPGYDEPGMRTHLECCGACAEEAESLFSLVVHPPR